MKYGIRGKDVLHFLKYLASKILKHFKGNKQKNILRTWPTSAQKKYDGLSESKLQRHGFRRPKAQISGCSSLSSEEGLSLGIE